jgi:hypothetical protein
MIIGGIVARNFFGPYMDNFNDQWGTYIRMICLSVILLEGGMELEFSSEGALTMIILMTFIPTNNRVKVNDRKVFSSYSQILTIIS